MVNKIFCDGCGLEVDTIWTVKYLNGHTVDEHYCKRCVKEMRKALHS